jgi:hypothetical protein
MAKSEYGGPCIEAGRFRAVPLGGCTTCWQIQRKAGGKDGGPEYWRPIDRYPGSIQAACETLFEMAGSQVPGCDFPALLRGLAALKDEITETCRECCEALGGRRG